MKEIKDFIDMMEEISDQEEREFESLGGLFWRKTRIALLREIIDTSEYQALEAVLSMPVSEDKPDLRPLSQKPLEDSLPNIYNTQHNDLMREIYKYEYRKPTDTQDKDGWIEHDGKGCPIGKGMKIEVKWNDGAKKLCLADEVSACWEWRVSGRYGIIAYRIIEEPKKQTLEEFCIRNTPQGNLDVLTPTELVHLISEWEQNK